MHRRLAWSLVLAVALTCATLPATSASAAARHVQVRKDDHRTLTGADVSWPQCPKGMGIPTRKGQDQPMPRRSARFVVLGLTNGPGFHRNPCLRSQVRWVKKRHLRAAAYAMTTFPTRKQLRRHGRTGPYRGRSSLRELRNAGYAQARFNLRTLKRVRLRTPVIWVDVEPYAVRPWSGSTTRNRAVVRGAVRAYQRAGYRVGIYSTTYLWSSVVGRARWGLPEWRTAGPTSRSAARGRCASGQIQGGPAVLAQWWNSRRDFDLTCPRYSSTKRLRLYFHKY